MSEAQEAAPRLIAFEGVDGAGKSTVIARVAEALRASGARVFMPRMGKEHASRPTRQIRNLTRDRRNLDLTPRAELLLYCAREAQILDELVRPALARGETVLIDRSLLTPVVLGRARGVPADDCEHAAAVAARGLEPDLTLVFDVHPRTSRIRKRIDKIRHPSDQEGGRKGLAGSAFKERVRDCYGQLANERGYPLFHVERATPDQLAERVLRVVQHGAGAGVDESELDRKPQWLVEPGTDFMQALETLPEAVALFLSNGLICARELRKRAFARDPRLAAWAMDPEDPLRDAIAEQVPDLALRALSRMPLGGHDDLRLKLLPRAPEASITALRHLHDERADAIRTRHAESHPNAVLESLAGRDDAFGDALRERCWKGAEDTSRASSLLFCDGDAAWKRREKLLERHPAAGLSSLRGLGGERVDGWLERYAERAPKRVLSALGGRSDDAAYALRERLFETGREVIDSVRGQGDDGAFALRERGVTRWPSTVAHSLLGLSDDPRSAALIARCEELAAGDLHVWRRLVGLQERAAWPSWARVRTRDTLSEDVLDDD
ncbi:MAG: thymidylate kinase [Myxococcales bacterium]|nr:thymidylate kinase [Myxococcales bacterium]